jgi:hypothetical protein
MDIDDAVARVKIRQVADIVDDEVGLFHADWDWERSRTTVSTE